MTLLLSLAIAAEDVPADTSTHVHGPAVVLTYEEYRRAEVDRVELLQAGERIAALRESLEGLEASCNVAELEAEAQAVELAEDVDRWRRKAKRARKHGRLAGAVAGLLGGLLVLGVAL